ncbi:MAG: NAD-dependent deacylase [Candidatus Hydrogenedentota bacterium]|nr:MAG: NAD-dependent deacylase [Candidatus Hydrogenedentota bacterium]
MSAESGVRTFRGSGGLWEGYRVEDVATPDAFARNPELVWKFYLERRRQLQKVQPNAGHRAVAAWREWFGEVPVVTQNVDGLHQRAGSVEVIELHGSLIKVRCFDCGGMVEKEPFSTMTELPEEGIPRCVCGGLLRPAVVWFGEALPDEAYRRAVELVTSCELLVVIGTSNVVYPAAALPVMALEHGAKVVEVNIERTALTPSVHRFYEGPAGEILPRWRRDEEPLSWAAAAKG